MYINSNNIFNNDITPSFTSKSKIIRDLDGVYRGVIKNLPVTSCTKLETKSLNSRKKSNNIWKLYRYSSDLISEMRGYASANTDSIGYLHKIIWGMRNLKVGDCSEQAKVTAISCKLSGFKNAKTMIMCAYSKKTDSIRNLGHTVVGVNFRPARKNKPANVKNDFYFVDNQSIIMDPWDGFVDFSKNARTRYMNNSNFKLKLQPDEDICFVPVGNVNNLTKKDLISIKKKFPFLSDKELSFLSKIRWFFMDKRKYDYPEFPICIQENLKKVCNMKSAKTNEDLRNLLNTRK